MLLEELRSALVHPGRLVVHVGCMFMGSGMPALMPRVLVLAYGVASSLWLGGGVVGRLMLAGREARSLGLDQSE